MAKASGNLALSAALALAAATGKRKPPRASLMLTKRIPLAAGLGGGSADAAATLRLLNRYWKLGLGGEALAGIGLSLGADVPMCLSRQAGCWSAESASGWRRSPAYRRCRWCSSTPPSRCRRRWSSRDLPSAAERPCRPLPERFGSVIAFVQWLRKTRNDLTERGACRDRPCRAGDQGAIAGDPRLPVRADVGIGRDGLRHLRLAGRRPSGRRSG